MTRSGPTLAVVALAVLALLALAVLAPGCTRPAPHPTAFAHGARRFARLVQRDGHGCDQAVLRHEPEAPTARVALRCNGQPEGFTLQPALVAPGEPPPPAGEPPPPAGEPPPGGFFVLAPDDATAARDRDRIAGLLARAFPTDPWVTPGGTFDAGNAVDLRSERGILAVLALTLAGGLAYVFAAQPGKSRP